MASCTPTAPVPATIGDVSHAAATATSGLAGATGSDACWCGTPGRGSTTRHGTQSRASASTRWCSLPDSDFLVTGGAGRAAIWNVREGAKGGVQLEVDPSRRDAYVLVGVRDDGTLVTFSEGTGVREWDVTPEGLLEHACTLVGRNLTEHEWADVLPDRRYERTCPEYPAGP